MRAHREIGQRESNIDRSPTMMIGTFKLKTCRFRFCFTNFRRPEEKPEALADATLPDDQRPDCDARHLVADVHVQVPAGLQLLPSARGLAALWTVQRMRGYRDGCREVARAHQTLRVPEGRFEGARFF